LLDQTAALEESVARVRRITESLGPDQLREQAYPAEWSIADVLSHLGSSAVILRRRMDDSLAGRETHDDLARSVWDEWNPKSPDEKASDALVADQALLDRIESLTQDEAARFRFSLASMSFDLAGFVGLRLNEHALHTWDIEVVLDPNATLPERVASLVVDNLAMIARFTGKATGDERSLHVHTIEPTRDFNLSIGQERVSLEPSGEDPEPDLELPAEAFIRLVYGRLDAVHTPPTRGSVDVDELRRVFPGV
jgi:uncharacterized protein (TIGR03083 family)